MKFFFAFVTTFIFSFALNAQTNSSVPTATNKEQQPTQVFSDSVDIDLKAHVAVYRGHVRVDSPQMKMTCETMTATVPEAGGKIENIVAEQNVVVDMTDEKGQPSHAAGEKMVYTYKVTNSVTNELVELTGNPRLESAQGTLTGDLIVWDRINNKLRATNPKMVFRAAGETNPFSGTGGKSAK